MSNSPAGVITPPDATWADIPSIGTDWVPLGGVNGAGNANAQAVAIAQRLAYLQARGGGGSGVATPHLFTHAMGAATFTAPADGNYFFEAWGGGASGGSGTAGANRGGGGGSYACITLALAAGATVAIQVGAGGIAATNASNVAGHDTTLTYPGHNVVASGATTFASNTPTGGQINLQGQNGEWMFLLSAGNTCGGTGGGAPHGGLGGIGETTVSNGEPGGFPGGGGGSSPAALGGNGGDGLVIVWY